ncbi:MAG: C1 family peptidase [Thiohalocapsa sp.]|nr:C1 family peptidase [Thiohalocapsa sp.]
MDWTDEQIAALARNLSLADRRALDTAIGEADAVRRLLQDPGRSPRDLRRAGNMLANERWLNVRPDPVDFRDAHYEAGLIPLAAHVDPPAELSELEVRDQGWLSSCTGMALATAVDVQRLRLWRAAGSRGAPPQPVSARMLYEMGRAHDELPDDGMGGSSVRGVLRGFFHNGVCPEVEEDDSPMEAPLWRLTVDKARLARDVTLGGYQRLRHVLLDYHCAINEANVLVVSARVHDGWRPGRRLDGERGLINWDGSQAVTGGHAFAVVGYDAEGFLVRNSWGRNWSTWTNAGGDAVPGVAHWSYDDWERHVLDAWVIRLAVPTKRHQRSVGGYFGGDGLPARERRVSAPRLLVNGHYLHLQDGRYVEHGTFNSYQESIDATARLIASSTKYDHLLIAIESGLDNMDSMVNRAAVLTPHLKRLRIYPLFIWWRSDVQELTSGMLTDRARRLAARTGGVPEIAGRLLVSFARDFLQPVWRTFEGEAERAFVDREIDRRRGRGWQALRPMLEAALGRAQPLHVHAVVHGAGAVFFDAFCRRILSDSPPSSAAGTRPVFSTVSLLAPILSPNRVDELASLWNGPVPHGAGPPLGIYTLSEEHDAGDRVGAFPGSFLELARRAFPLDGQVVERTSASIDVLGHASQAKRLGYRRDTRWYPVQRAEVGSACRTHQELAHDEAVLRHLIARVLASGGASGRGTAAEQQPDLPNLGASQSKH